MDFFNKVHAQEADATAKATIPFTPPNVPTPTGIAGWTATPTPASGPMIFLETESVQIGLNEKILIKVKIFTANVPIKSLKFSAKYDTTYFRITDAEPNVANVQISYNDDFFLNDVNEVDTSTGKINVIGVSEEGTSTITNRAVAEFELTSIKEGFSEVSLDITNSALIDDNSTDILKSIGQPLNFVISEVAITVTPTTPMPTPTGTLPRNGFFDEFGATQALVYGSIMIAIGVYLFRLPKNAKS